MSKEVTEKRSGTPMRQGAGLIDKKNRRLWSFYTKTKGFPDGNPLFNLAEAQRFELWNPFGSPVFKTGAFNRSATLPE